MRATEIESDTRIDAARACSEEINEARERMRRAAAHRRELVRALHADGWSYASIAAGLGCSRSAVQSILRDGSV